MTRYHIKADGTPGICRAKNKCPLGNDTQHFDSKDEADAFILKKHEENYGLIGDPQINLYKQKKANNEKFSTYEANTRALWVEEKTKEALKDKKDTLSIHFDKNLQQWSDERTKLHDSLLNELKEKYKNVPSDGQVIMSAGLPGSGKTTTLTRALNVEMDKYAMISSDDFKEMLAERGAVPEIEGLSPMEASTLVHHESSYLADRLLNTMVSENKNIIYDCTCKNEASTRKRLNAFLNNGYNNKNVQLVFVNISLDAAKERAKYRYKEGLNTSNIGGRHLPEAIINSCVPENSEFQSKNAETVVKLSNDDKLDLPTPLVFDNSGRAPIQIEFDDFKKGELL